MFNKELGILCHISSLYSDYGIGDIGKPARDFIDFLNKDGYTQWEILPLNKINNSNCPYSSLALMAQEELYIDLEPFVQDGTLARDEVDRLKEFAASEKVEFDKIRNIKYELLDKIFERKGEEAIRKGQEYMKEDSYIKDYAFYRVFTDMFGNDDWTQWPLYVKTRTPSIMQMMEAENSKELAKYAYFQSVFSEQFKSLQDYAHHKNVKIVGDCAIYPNPNSVDVWVNQGLFKLDEKGLPYANGGVPGQNWGTCVYRWADKKEEVFNWWFNRIDHDLKLYDVLRIDHYIGLCNHYEIPKDRNPHEGEWVDGGGYEFFERLFNKVPVEKIVVEDMGAVIPREALEIRDRFNIKGMALSQYAFDGNPDNIYLPHKVRNNTMYYIGTHDHNTLKGFLDKADEGTIHNLHKYFWLQHQANSSELSLRLLKAMLHSNATNVMFQLQDVLLQDEKYMMNRVGEQGQWCYKAPKDYATYAIHPSNLKYMFYTKQETNEKENNNMKQSIFDKLNNKEKLQ